MSGGRTSRLALSSTDSDEDFEAKNRPAQSAFARPKSAAANRVKKNVRIETSSDEEETKQSNSKLESKVKTEPEKSNFQKSSFMERITGSNESRSRTPSTERENKTPEKKPSKDMFKKVDHFSRPRSRFGSTPSSSSDEKSSKNIKSPEATKASNGAKKDSSDESTKRENKWRGKLPRSSSNSSKSRSRSNSTSSNETPKKAHKPFMPRSSASSSDDENDKFKNKGDVNPIRVNIQRKPPIDKSSWKKKHNRSSSLEKPTDSASDSELGKISNGRHSSMNFNLPETYNPESDNNSSSNEITDVSPLPSPKRGSRTNKLSASRKKTVDTRNEHAKLDMSVFYKALNEDLDKRMDSVFNTFGKKFGKPSHNYEDLELNDPEFASKMMRIDAENKNLYKKLIKTEISSKAERPFRVTSSALNRQREQQKIEKENQVNS